MDVYKLQRLGALARSRVNRTLPQVEQAATNVRRAVGRWVEQATGPEFERKAARLRERYELRRGSPLGLDPATAERALELLSVLYRFWFRTQVFGMDHVPDGRLMLVANHSGQLPLDACMIATALFLERDPPRFVRSLVDRWADEVPVLSDVLARTGQVLGVPENGRRLLEDDECVLVFPEGVRGVSKPFSRRYKLEPFGSGFARLALETHAPVLPVGVVGAEEQYVSIGNFRWAARRLGLPSFPVLPQLLVPGGQLPLPTRYRIYFGEPQRLRGDPNDAQDVERGVHSVREAVEHLVLKGLEDRKAVFW